MLGKALGGAHSQNYKGPTRGRAEAAPYSESALPQGFAFPCIKYTATEDSKSEKFFLWAEDLLFHA